jgi:alpha-1,2-mannosyltransferase
MAHFWQALQSGEWLTPARARAYSLILLGLCTIAIVTWVALSVDLIDRNGKPIGTDFSSFYAAGSTALEGHAAEAYDPSLHHAREQKLFGPETPYYSWNYPPVFFLVAAPLALLPYPLALALFQTASLAFFLSVIAAILGSARQRSPIIARNWLPAAAGFPAVFLNLGHGQNGFLTASLMGAALVKLDRPVISGLCIGLLSYKPQFALVIPIALLAAGRWRTIGSAALTTVMLVAVSWFLFGIDAWTMFLDSTEMSRKVLLEQGSVGFEKLQSVFAAVRLWGGAVPLAYALQGAVSVFVILATAWTWRGPEHRELKAAALAVGSLLATPHVLDYDLVVLGIAIAYFARLGLIQGFRACEISVLAAAWLAPLLTRGVAQVTAIPLGLLVLLTFYVFILRRAVLDRANVTIATANIAHA